MPKKISDIRRGEIVQALNDAIAADGISLPSYDLIARRGDMSRQLVRHYYRDAEQMAVDLCDHLVAVHRDLMVRGIAHADPRDRLRLLLDFHFDLLAGSGLPKPPDDAVYDAMFALAGTSERVRERLREQHEELLRTFADEVQKAHPQLAEAACRDLAYLIATQIHGHWRMKATLGMDAGNTVPRDALDRLIASYLDNHHDHARMPDREVGREHA